RAHSAPDEHADEHADVHEMDPDRLPLGAALSGALHEWAQVADAVGAIDGERDKAGALVSRRGRQLAGRVAAALGVPIDYADPVTGEVYRVDASALGQPDVDGPTSGFERQRFERSGFARSGFARPYAGEPTPWATGLTITVFTAVLVVIAVLALATALSQTSPWLSMIANLVVTVGLAPSVVLAKRVPVWRWVAYGVIVGLALAWLGWLLSLL
ncbi:MAG: DUF2537 domain-containing protein, partial [Sciscionella sp.]|nr:DUF2537 domain-containing protein [Sciscionella sp.]